MVSQRITAASRSSTPAIAIAAGSGRLAGERSIELTPLNAFGLMLDRSRPILACRGEIQRSHCFVIPALLARAAGERDQAGTHAPQSLLSDRIVGTTAPRLPGGMQMKDATYCDVHGLHLGGGSALGGESVANHRSWACGTGW